MPHTSPAPRWLLATLVTLYAAPALAQQPTSLDQLLDHAMTHAPGMARARLANAERAALDAQARQRWTENPSIQLIAGPRLTPNGQGVDLQLALNQTLPTWGLLDTRREAADAGRALLDAEITADQAAVRGQIRAAWAEALWARRRVEVAQASATLAQRVADTVAKQADAGESSALDARLTQADAAQAMAAVEAANARLDQAMIALGVAAGWPADTPLALPPDLPEPAPVPALDALRPHRRSTLAAERRVNAALAARTVTQRANASQLALSLQLQREGNPEGAEWVAFGGVSYTPALWQRGQAQLALDDLELERARLDLLLAQRALDAELRLRHAQAVATYKAWSTLRGSLIPRFEQDLNLVLRAWELGELRLIEALAARERLLKLEQDAADAWGAHLTARAHLDALLLQDTP